MMGEACCHQSQSHKQLWAKQFKFQSIYQSEIHHFIHQEQVETPV